MTERMIAFREAFHMLERRVQLLVALPIRSLDRLALTRKVDEIGRLRPDTITGQAS
jgi:arsenate reductase